MVNSAPATIGGDKLKTTFRPGPENNGTPELSALRSIDQPAIKTDTSASAAQTRNQILKGCFQAISAATNADPPIATSPQPEMPVNDDERSMVSRMYRRLSMARSCNAGGASWDGGIRLIVPIVWMLSLLLD